MSYSFYADEVTRKDHFDRRGSASASPAPGSMDCFSAFIKALVIIAADEGDFGEGAGSSSSSDT